MQIHTDLYHPEDYRAAATFFGTLADNLDARHSTVSNPAITNPAAVNSAVTFTGTPAPEEKVEKKSRAKKTEAAPAVTEPAATPATAEAPAAPETKVDPSDDFSEPEDNPLVGKSTDEVRDLIRTQLGSLSQSGRRNEALSILKAYQQASGGAVNGVRDIQEADVISAWSKLNQLLNA